MGGDAPREFKIKITGDAADLVRASSQSADSLGTLTIQVDKAGQAQTEAGKATEKHTEHLHAMHRVFHSLNEVVPGLGAIMQAAFSPIGATISVALIALNYFREKIRQTNETLQRMEDEAAKPLGNLKGAVEDAGIAARKAKEDFDNWQASVGAKTNEAVDALDHEIKKINAVASALRDLREGKTPEVSEGASELAIRKATESALSQARAGKRATEMALPGAEATANDAMRAARMSELSKPVSIYSDETRKEIKKAVKAAQKEVDRLSELYKKALLRPESEQTGGYDPSVIMASLQGARTKLAEAEAPKSEEQFNEARKRRLAELQEEQRSADKVLDDLKKQFQDFTTQANTLSKRLESINDAQSARSEAEIQTSGVPRNLAGTLLKDILAQEGRARGESMTREDAEGNRLLFQLLQQRGVSAAQQHQLIRDMMNVEMAHTQKIQELAQALGVVKSQLNSLHRIYGS